MVVALFIGLTLKLNNKRLQKSFQSWFLRFGFRKQQCHHLIIYYCFSGPYRLLLISPFAFWIIWWNILPQPMCLCPVHQTEKYKFHVLLSFQSFHQQSLCLVAVVATLYNQTLIPHLVFFHTILLSTR